MDPKGQQNDETSKTNRIRVSADEGFCSLQNAAAEDFGEWTPIRAWSSAAYSKAT